jgi:hypothetical protein
LYVLIIGDILWVRETFRPATQGLVLLDLNIRREQINLAPVKWKPSLFSMPKKPVGIHKNKINTCKTHGISARILGAEGQDRLRHSDLKFRRLRVGLS